MARHKTRTLTELELTIMQVVWKHGEVTVEAIRQALDAQDKSLALPSIRTMLGILQSKGYVTRRGEGRRHVYRARVPQDDARRSILKDVVRRAFEGSALSLVATLIDGQVASPSEINKVKRLIREAERRATK